jgi:hypothetical protein
MQRKTIAMLTLWQRPKSVKVQPGTKKGDCLRFFLIVIFAMEFHRIISVSSRTL